jgi:hypothetical protein
VRAKAEGGVEIMRMRMLLGVLAVYVAWSVLDFVIHGVMLQTTYEATASLWRPMEEMKMGLMYVVTLIAAACFVAVYEHLISAKSVRSGLLLGLLYGVGVGTSMGHGSYAVMPIPYNLALSWFLGTLVEAVVAGLLVGVIVTPRK